MGVRRESSVCSENSGSRRSMLGGVWSAQPAALTNRRGEMTDPTIDLDPRLKLRLVVARFGEMDLAKWWNTKGQLGKLGAASLRRGFPRTHYFAQASSVFAVAAHRCAEVFEPPNSVT